VSHPHAPVLDQPIGKHIHSHQTPTISGVIAAKPIEVKRQLTWYDKDLNQTHTTIGVKVR
jgi:hypothetical protein